MLVIQFIKSPNGLLGVEYSLSTYCCTAKLGVFHSLTEHANNLVLIIEPALRQICIVLYQF